MTRDNYKHDDRKGKGDFTNNQSSKQPAIKSSKDGRAIVLGTVDGCMSVLAIVDPKKEEMNEYLNDLPSRDENWKAKLAKMKARVGFKAAIRVATISSRYAKTSKGGEDGEEELLTEITEDVVVPVAD